VTFPNPKTILKIITHTENNHRYKKEKLKKIEYKQHEKLKNKTKQKSKHSQKQNKKANIHKNIQNSHDKN